MLSERQTARDAPQEAPTIRRATRVTPRPLVSLTADDGQKLADEAADALGLGKYKSDEDKRPVHTHGSLASGTFTANPGAGEKTSAAHLQAGVTTPVLARFSNSRPGPNRDDRVRSARGLAVRFETAAGPPTDLVAMNTDRFFVADREQFGALSRALKSFWMLTLPRLVSLIALRRTRLTLVARLATMWPPNSYARCAYHGISTFIWRVDRAGQPVRTAVRFRWIPDAGRSRLAPWRRLHPKGPTFLEQDLQQRLESKSKVTFRLEVQFGDDVADKLLVDSTRPWNVEWETVGTLDLETFVGPGEAARLDPLSFSPLHLCPGIEAHPGDKILALRGAAYAAAHVRRTEARR